MSNPLLSEKYFGDGRGGAPVIDATATEAGWGAAPPGHAPGPVTATRSGTMTYGGVTSAAGVMLLFLLAAGWFGWTRVSPVVVEGPGGGVLADSTPFPTGWLFGSILVGFVLAIICSFKPPLARFLAVPYAIAEGIAIGVISHFYDARTEGVVVQAIIATLAVFGVMLALYGFRVLRVTPRMTKAIVAATFGVMAVYLVGWIASIFSDAPVRFMDSTSGLSIGISLLVVGIAAFNLLLDFDFIERGVQQGLPKQMEWFAAFGLIVTLVWLYLELLRLLSKLQRR